MKIALLVLMSATVALAVAPDTIPAAGGNITIQPINHATLELTYAGKVIDIDPVAQANFEGLPAPDIILITDIHQDHLDPSTVAKRRKDTTKTVAPAAAASKLQNAIVIKNGETKDVDGIAIEAVPMYNLQRGPSPGQLFHDKGRGNGYVLTLGGKRVYVAGDTECIPEMKTLKNIDVAFVPMNLPYTMPPSKAAECVKAFKPKIVYPYHYRGQNLDEFANALKGSGIDVRIRDWYAAR
jgi:L-ascorbate metabolism protein UlaG (beta-lactamase superfamily)